MSDTHLSEYEKMLAGQLYWPTDPELVALRLKQMMILEELNRTSVSQPDLRTKLLKRLFGSTGEKLVVESPFRCDYGTHIHVGENFYANAGCVILDCAEVRIGNNVMFGPQVNIYTPGHPLEPGARISGIEFAKTITIGDNCWIGGMAVLNPGVTLGKNVVVASGAVVTKSFGDNMVIGGNPARVMKEINPDI